MSSRLQDLSWGVLEVLLLPCWLMENPSRPVCLIENAIDRLIEYGDRIHAAHKYADEHKEKVHSKHGTPHYGCPTTRSRLSIHSERRSGYTTKKSQSIDILVSKPGKQSQATSKRGKQPQLTPYQSFLASMLSKRLPDSWIQVEFMLYDEDGTQLLELRTEVFGEALRNTVVNGKSVEFM
ncbi:unnamed protein product [Haemonchus placei]|uniref:PB1 domain-containing protein n=1 Tax=Haemonchus placei TaxID=6290 RepID=A0A0N4W281_HAEPC|nr:unnamed protein product [Haemonchus placei]